jgi:hypothetical protein
MAEIRCNAEYPCGASAKLCYTCVVTPTGYHVRISVMLSQIPQSLNRANARETNIVKYRLYYAHAI